MGGQEKVGYETERYRDMKASGVRLLVEAQAGPFYSISYHIQSVLTLVSFLKRRRDGYQYSRLYISFEFCRKITVHDLEDRPDSFACLERP